MSRRLLAVSTTGAPIRINPKMTSTQPAGVPLIMTASPISTRRAPRIISPRKTQPCVVPSNNVEKNGAPESDRLFACSGFSTSWRSAEKKISLRWRLNSPDVPVLSSGLSSIEENSRRRMTPNRKGPVPSVFCT